MAFEKATSFVALCFVFRPFVALLPVCSFSFAPQHRNCCLPLELILDQTKPAPARAPACLKRTALSAVIRGDQSKIRPVDVCG